MRKLIWMMSVSVDGFMSRPNGELDWQLVDDELHRHFNEELASMSAFLDGRVTYELMAGFWPTADSDPANAGPVADFARIWRDMPKIVYSRTLEHAGWNTTIIRNVVVEDVLALKAGDGGSGDLMMGGGDLAMTFMDHDLIDEYRLYIHPVVIGEGKPMFALSRAQRDQLDLRLVEARTFGSGVILLRYQGPRPE